MSERYEWVRGEIGLQRVIDDEREPITESKTGVHRLVTRDIDEVMMGVDAKQMFYEHVRHTQDVHKDCGYAGVQIIGSTTLAHGVTHKGYGFHIEIRVGAQQSYPPRHR